MPYLLGISTLYNNNCTYFFIQSKKSRRRTASEKGKNVQYNKNKISSDFLTSFVTYTCKCFIHHTIIILFLLSEFLAIAFASTA